ncbi:hypothetical protein [Hafnia phage Pocis76]|uniref:Uncharacterized protein n=1 Tax=Hafnia phage Pocis76 TaxID=2831174 RepID=A0A8E7KY22_9CAUD|nr:hypothetical protein [Hafnia phage Pocis76]
MKLTGKIYRDALNTPVFVDTSEMKFSRVSGRAYHDRYVWMEISECWIKIGREYTTAFRSLKQVIPVYDATIEVK